jgi:hypothetical protein
MLIKLTAGVGKEEATFAKEISDNAFYSSKMKTFFFSLKRI